MSERSRRYSPRPRAFVALIVFAGVIAAGSVAGTLALHRGDPAAASQR